MTSVLLIGCGNIGFRHLQAIAQMSRAATITIVEPSVAAHPRIAALIAAHQGPHRFSLQEVLPDTAQHFDLAVIATSANHRRAVVESLLQAHSVGVMILEKVLFQYLADLCAVESLLVAKGVQTYVNCGRRYFPSYVELKNRFSAQKPVNLMFTGHEYGLASNAIHFIDVAEFLNDSAVSKVDATGLLAGAMPTKRANCVEVFGTLTAQLANGARLTMDCRAGGNLSVYNHLSSGAVSIDINQISRQMTEGDQTAAFVMKNVSECTEIYEEALAGTCRLTSYTDSARQHRLFLGAILGHLGLPEAALCPIS